MRTTELTVGSGEVRLAGTLSGARRCGDPCRWCC